MMYFIRKIKIIVFVLMTLLCYSCSKESIENLGYITGQLLVYKLSGNTKLINGDLYYETVRCNNINYTDIDDRILYPVKCIVMNEIAYVTFHATYSVIKYTLD